MSVHVCSEVGRLRSVLVHRPGLELSGITPSNEVEWLFDEPVYWKAAAIEHDAFTDALRGEEVDVVEFGDCLFDAYSSSDEAMESFYGRWIDSVKGSEAEASVRSCCDGMRESPVGREEFKGRVLFGDLDGIRFVGRAVPNLYFTRDAMSVIGDGFSIS